MNLTNKTVVSQEIDSSHDDPSDAIWILTSAFIIFTMQSGFGLLEAGMVSGKNETNIMVKNAVDVIFGGLAYWVYGFAFSYGTTEEKYQNPFTSLGQFFVDADEANMGHVFSKYIFQLSFATTATTIVSGAMAERTNLKAYMIFSFWNTLSYCFPAHWIWNEKGFLKTLGAIDFAGCGPVHLVGGVSAVVATLMLGPRNGRFDKNYRAPSMSSPTNVMLGTFMLWWGWLGFNCGSTFGISGQKWKLASRAAVVTVNGSIGGAICAIIYSYHIGKKHRGTLNVPKLANGILGGLVSITGLCAIAKPWEGLFCGFIGGLISTAGEDFIEYLGIDDPVGCIPVHCLSAIWGLIVVAFFAEKDTLSTMSSSKGLFKGGKWSFLGAQVAAACSMIVWSALSSFVLLWIINKFISLRSPLEEELQGADFSEHGIGREKLHHFTSGTSCCLGNGRTEISNNLMQGRDLSVDLSFVNNTLQVQEEEKTVSNKSSVAGNGVKNHLTRIDKADWVPEQYVLTKDCIEGLYFRKRRTSAPQISWQSVAETPESLNKVSGNLPQRE